MLQCLVILIILRILLVASDQTTKPSEDVMTKLAEFEERLKKQEKVFAAKEEFQTSKIKALEKQVEVILENRHEMETITQKIDALQQKCDQSRQVKRAIDGGIAFSAFMNHDQDFGAGQTIKFNQIITNEGNGYNAHTGVFICPEAGMYLFTFFVGERGEQDGVEQIYADLKINSKNVMDAVAETRYYQEDTQGGNIVVVRLAQGDSVWVSCRVAGHHIEGDASRITSFTGIFLYA